MSRPMLLVFLLLVMIITSQFEWRQQLVTDVDANHSLSQKQLRVSKREEAVKEKVDCFCFYAFLDVIFILGHSDTVIARA
ncbi:hypothetical protein KSS87_003533, partial [Heliosperma pusillum]